jgi:PhnB protein
MKLTTYVNFPGKCAEAIEFYEKHLGAKMITKSTWADMPENPNGLPQGMTADMILHARFMVGDTVVMASDGPHVEPMRSAYLALSVDNNEEAERIYKALTEGGQVFMAMTETFFAHRFGQFRDKFGVNWMVIHERPMPRG